MDHLLLHCHVAHSLWVRMLQVFGIQWVMPGSVDCGVLLEFLVGEIFFRHLEHGSWLIDVGCLDGKKLALF